MISFVVVMVLLQYLSCISFAEKNNAGIALVNAGLGTWGLILLLLHWGYL